MTGASLGYQIASTLGGGFSPLIAATLAAAGGFPPVTFYIMATFVLSLFIVWLAKEGVQTSRRRFSTLAGRASRTPTTSTARRWKAQAGIT